MHPARKTGYTLELRRLISSRNYGSWLFETEIPQGGRIAPLVQDAIKECEFFVSYVTRRSIGSLWVQKEIEVARRSDDCKKYVIVDGRDEGLLRLFENWTDEWPPKGEKTQEFCSAAAKDIDQASASAWERRCQAFVNSLHEYVGNTNQLLSYPSVRESSRWRGKRLRIESFEQFLSTIAERDQVGSRG